MPYKENAKYTEEDPRDTSDKMKEKARGTGPGERAQEEKNTKQPRIEEQPGPDPAAN